LDKSLRILILEDQPEYVDILALRLQEDDVEAKITLVGARDDYLKALNSSKFDAIISDYNLPDINGKEALALAKQICPGTPLIIFTGSVGEEIAVECMNEGAADYVLKQQPTRLVPALMVVAHARKEVERKRTEEALRTSEERLRVGLNTANIAVFNQGLDLRYNWMYQPQLGYTSEQVAGHTDAELLPPEAAKQVMEIKRRVLESGQKERAEVPVSVGGQTFVYDLVAEPLRDASGAIIGLTGASLDITERKRAEEALSESERRQRSILDNVDEIVYMVEARKENMLNGKLIFVSPRTRKIIGYDPEDFIGDPGLWFKLLHPEDIPTVMDKTNEMYSHKQMQTREYRIRHKLTGDYVWMEDRVVPQLDVKGEVVGQFGAARDITERKRMQERLAKLSSVVEQSADCVFITDNNGVIQYVNKAFEDTTGYGKQEAIGKTPRILKSGKHDDVFYAKLWKEILSGKAVRVEFLNRRKNGELYHDERTITCLKDKKGSITNFVATGRDVTVRRRADEALRKTGDRLRFLSRSLLTVQESERRTIAREIHDELGGAFTTLKVNLQTLQSNRDQAEWAPRIIDSIGIIDRAIDQIRALAISLRPSALDDLGLPAALRWYIDRQAQRVGFVPSVSIEPSLPRFSQDIETACFRVAQEALTNVARHAKASKVILDLYIDQEQLHLVITDDGVGFDVEKVKEQHELGLGILGMRERVSFAGGSFELESSTGRGTKVSAHFPLPAHNSSQASPQSAGGE